MMTDDEADEYIRRFIERRKTRVTRGKSAKNLKLIATAYDILEEIQPATVRAVCYQLFRPHKLIDSMDKEHTKRVSVQLVYARERGIIPWKWIVDETRQPVRVPQWADPAEFAESVQSQYRKDRWTEQPRIIEVWSEKGTVGGTLAPILDKYGVTFQVFHGWGSATTVHDAAEASGYDLEGTDDRLALYVGDWDPSGMWMSERDLPERLERYGGNIEIRRIALDELDTHDGLASFPVESKEKDTRYKWFRENYGERCWELDAMRPTVLRDRVEEAILAEIDQEAWDRADKVESAEHESIIHVLQQLKAAKG